MITARSLIQLAKNAVRPSKPGFIKVPLASGFSLELYDRPGVWMSDAELASLVSDIRDVYARAMPGPVPNYGALSGQRADMKRRLISIARTSNGKSVAFCAQARLRVNFGEVTEEVVHLGLVSVDPEYRKSGLQGVLYSIPVIYLFFASGMSRLYFTNVTQVPAIIGQCEDYFYDVYPSSKRGKAQGYHHHRIASTIYEQYRSIFGVGDDSVYLPERQIIQNSYTGGSDELKKTFEKSAMHRRPEVNEFCRANLDYERGDDFIQVGLMDYRSFFSFFRSRHQGNPLVQYTLGFLVWSLQSVFVPIFQWVMYG